jgi:hypothetical protein
MADIDQMNEIKPLIPESSTSESTTVEVVLNDLRDGTLEIPDYQRDSDQWDETTKSLFVESVINNLSIPAFFFEVTLEGGVEKNYVVDGQQRLTTLSQFHRNKLRMVNSDDASYLSPISVHYANRTFDELPTAYQQAFKKYRLTVIKLRNLGDMRLEVFRRINQGGTPLSGQDIRLAYYGKDSPSLALIRLAGAYDPEKPAAKRFLVRAKNFKLDYPWKNEIARECWKQWWEGRDIARGQTASEMFLWSMISAQVEILDSLLQNDSALQALGCRYNGTVAVDTALDAYCAQLRYDDCNVGKPPVLMPFSEIRDQFFPAFENWIGYLLSQKGPGLDIRKHRSIGALIGATYAYSVNPSDLNEQQWTDLVEFVRNPKDMAKKFSLDYPQSKGRWGGIKGYRAQLLAVQQIVRRIVS